MSKVFQLFYESIFNIFLILFSPVEEILSPHIDKEVLISLKLLIGLCFVYFFILLTFFYIVR